MDVILNDIARIQEANRLDVLLDGLVILLLLEELVGVLLDYLTLDLSREVRLAGNGLRLGVVALLHQVVDLDVVLHGVQLDQLPVHPLPLVALSDVVYPFLTRSLLDLHVNNGAVRWRVPIHRDLVFEVVDRELRLCGTHLCWAHGRLGDLFDLYDVVLEEVEHLFWAL